MHFDCITQSRRNILLSYHTYANKAANRLPRMQIAACNQKLQLAKATRALCNFKRRRPTFARRLKMNFLCNLHSSFFSYCFVPHATCHFFVKRISGRYHCRHTKENERKMRYQTYSIYSVKPKNCNTKNKIKRKREIYSYLCI